MAMDDLYAPGTPFAIAEAEDGAVGGFLHLAPSPAGGGWSLSTMRRRAGTPNGLTEFLVVETLAWAKEHGASRALAELLRAHRLAPPDRADTLPRRMLRAGAARRRQRLPARAAALRSTASSIRSGGRATSASSGSATCRSSGSRTSTSSSCSTPPGPWTRGASPCHTRQRWPSRRRGASAACRRSHRSWCGTASATSSRRTSSPTCCPDGRRRRGSRPRESGVVGARPASARAARRARPDVREVRPAALDAARHRAARHHRRAARAPGRRAPVPVRAGRARDRGGSRQLARAPLPRRSTVAGRRRVDRPGAPRDAPERQAVAVKVQRPGAPRQIEADLALLYQAAKLVKERVRALDFIDARGLIDEFARQIRQELDYRLEGRNAQTFHRNFAGAPARARAEGLLVVHARARADARVARGDAGRRHRHAAAHRSRSGATSRTRSRRRG